MRIGLTYTGSEEKHQNYVRWLKGQDEGVEVIRLSAAESPELLQQCDGLVLSGGVDIEPSLYGGRFDYEKAPLNGWQKDRDLFEQSVLLAAWDAGLPVLGVCRGLQLINVSCRGTLVQDLGAAGDEVHENVTGMDKRHPVRVLEGTLLANITGRQRGEANSAHHQAIDRLGEGLRVNSLAADGTIEGIEWAEGDGRPFMIAVQWHPERMFTNNLADTFLYKEIRDRYVQEVRSKLKK
ncbi:MAG TPA: gamma-glutamyl-gamma-aminobutyrate hydrolase family protein [Puia sp.]|nr:gamma-glutamyl-gamma-aminobutyrate hydrolase family protein [Puia sp.]